MLTKERADKQQHRPKHIEENKSKKRAEKISDHGQREQNEYIASS